MAKKRKTTIHGCRQARQGVRLRKARPAHLWTARRAIGGPKGQQGATQAPLPRKTKLIGAHSLDILGFNRQRVFQSRQEGGEDGAGLPRDKRHHLLLARKAIIGEDLTLGRPKQRTKLTGWLAGGYASYLVSFFLFRASEKKRARVECETHRQEEEDEEEEARGREEDDSHRPQAQAYQPTVPAPRFRATAQLIWSGEAREGRQKPFRPGSAAKT